MDCEDGGWDVDECQHINKEYYSENDMATMKSGNVVGYCTDCGAPVLKESTLEKCSHPTIKEDINGLTVCAVCFLEMEEQVSFEPEWKCYESASTGAVKDKSRCHRQRSAAPKGVASFFESKNLKLDDATTSRLEKTYHTIVDGSEKKETGRSGLIASLLFFDLWNTGNARTSDNVRELVGVSKKAMSTGMTRVYSKYPELRKKYITPLDLLNWLMSVCGIEEEIRPTIREFAETIITQFISFRKEGPPQHRASAIIYLYMCMNPEYKSKLGMNKTKFSEKTQIPDNTITKLLESFKAETGIPFEV